MRREDGTTQRTAGAILLGLLVATAPALAGCGADVAPGTKDEGGVVQGDGGGASEAGGDAGTDADADACIPMFTGADYGTPPTCR
jgi:hypothetical protein